MKLKEYRIQEICEIKSGKRIPLGFDFVTYQTPHPYIRARDIKNGQINTDDLIYLDDITYNKIKKYIINENDVAITIVGASVGDVGFAQKSVDGFNLTENAVRLTNFINSDSKYVFYLLAQKQYKELMLTIAGGAAQPKLGIYKIQKIKLVLPPLPTQQKIASILSCYDNLIQNYKKQIEALQTAASELYKEWFVRFRFPDYQTTKFENGIPVGWNYQKLFEFGYEAETGNRPSGGIDTSLEDGIPSLGAESIDKLGCFDYSNVKYIPRDFYNKMNRGHGKDDDILLYKDGAYIGKVTLFRNNYPFKEYVVNEHVFLLRANNHNYQNYLYFTLNMPQYFAQMQNLNRNAAQPGLARSDLDIIKLMVPEEKIVVEFNKIVNPMINNIFVYSKQITNLTQQRDLLLPRLMSGKQGVK